MAGDYRERLREAEALIQRARNEAERKAFEEIAAIWRRLLENRPAENGAQSR